jgi:membrane fusion protein, multidrug efflux system
VSLVQIDPIGVEFTLPEASLADVLRARASDQVRITLDRPDGPPLVGKLVFVNNTVNTDSATVSLKASFPNPRKLLWPGGYVHLGVDAGTDAGAIVLPPQAVMDGPQGRQVFVVDDELVAHRMPVTLLRVQDRQAVVQGLKGGERVVVEGLTDRRKVRLTGAEGAASSAAATDTPAGRSGT